MKLTELFDTPTPAIWKSPNVAYFNVDGVEYGLQVESRMLPTDEGEDCWLFDFFARINGAPKWNNTDTGNQYTVYSTVIGLMKQYMEKNGVRPFYMETNDAGRNSLYKRMLRRLVPDWTVDADEHFIIVYPPGVQHEQMS